MNGKKEIIEYRTPNTKHFLKKDGTIEVEIYKDPVHYLEKGEYKEIDNSLVKTTKGFKNKSNDFKVEFNENDSDSLVNISCKNKKISMFPKNMEQKISNRTLAKKTKSKIMLNDIKYENMYDDVDIDYKIFSNQLKESIILNRVPNDNRFTFVINTDLNLILNDDNTISFKDEKNECYRIERPYMVDNNSIYSELVKYELNKLENGYEIIIDADKEWLNDNERAYPVTIDPTITNAQSTSSVIDTYIYEGDVNATTYNQPILCVGADKEKKIYRSLLKFELPKIPAGYKVTEASVRMTCFPDEFGLEYQNNVPMVSVHALTQDWTESSAKWANMSNKYSKKIEDYFVASRKDEIHYDKNRDYVDCFNITSLVHNWYNGKPNYGIMLKEYKEEIKEKSRPAYYISKDAQIDTSVNYVKPLLVVTYKNYNGLEEYMSYTSQSHSFGTSHINNYTGNLTVLFNVANTVGGSSPVNFSLVYNTLDVEEHKDYGYGLGIKPNWLQTIEQEQIDEETMLKYLDGDGTVHYFYKKQDELENDIYYDEDGLGFSIKKKDNCYLLTDGDSNVSKFVKHSIGDNIYYLEQIVDSYNRMTNIIYSAEKITKVIDSSNNEINIIFEDNKIFFETLHLTTVVELTNNLLTSISSYGDIESISYNKDNLISQIVNINSLSIKYDYINDVSFKVRKMSEIGRQGTIGNTLEFSYNLFDTKVLDNKGLINTYIFNEYGNVIGITSLDEQNDLKNAYGKSYSFDGCDASQNKLTSDKSLIKYVDNLVDDSSFESGTSFRFKSTHMDNTNIATKSYTRSGEYSLEVEIPRGGESVYKEFKVEKGKKYTFSAYIRGMSYSIEDESPLDLFLYYDNSYEVTHISELTDDFVRYSVSIDYDINATDDLKVVIRNMSAEHNGFYLDDIQLEEGEVANYYNIIDNSGLKNGLLDWTINKSNLADDFVDIVNVTDEVKALRIHSAPQGYVSADRKFNIKGKKGDVFNFSFWYKNDAIIPSGGEGLMPGLWGTIFFGYPEDTEYGACVPAKYLNVGSDNWQFFSENFIAEDDYEYLEIKVNSFGGANECYLTNFSLFKDLECFSFDYDENGNLVSSSDLSKQKNEINYDKNNQLIKLSDTMGANFTFEYDNKVSDKVINSISPSGIINNIEYDVNGNPIKIKVNNRKILSPLSEQDVYYIRLKGTNKYFYVNPDKSLRLKESECSYDKFLIIKLAENKIKIKHAILNNYYIKIVDNNVKLMYGDDNNIFEILSNGNGSYNIQKEIVSEEETRKILTISDTYNIILSEINEENYKQEFYFEQAKNKLFIESLASYSEDGKFIKKFVDNLGNETEYVIDGITGLTTQIKDALGNITKFEYDAKHKINKISRDSHKVIYEYDSNNNLSIIKYGLDDYSFDYDEFNNTSVVKVNNKILESNLFEANNGNLTKIKYGNGNEISYEYDNFNRLITTIKSNDRFRNFYDNLGRITKSVSNNNVYTYNYDFAKRISSFKCNDYETNYDYNEGNNVIKKEEKLGRDSYVYNFTYNDENVITNLKILDKVIEYKYDILGRLSECYINNQYKIEYNYITIGNKTSTIISQINDNGDIYEFKYDLLGNITDILKNNLLINKYYYDANSQLIKEENLIKNYNIQYLYDDCGNILSKSYFDNKTLNLIKKDKYYYEDNEWHTLLTKFNDSIITYDTIGNPLTIDDINLTWINGRELSSYSDGTNTIMYEYNADGIRTSKIVNNKKINYYIENTSVIFENREDYVLYYFYNNDDILGFVYNNNVYYYHKNVFGDIIGIFDSKYNEIVTYEYDSWGALINLIDNSEINIGTINPFRYHSYYYDEETELYYLNSRYYNPKLGRFINSDSETGVQEKILSYNKFQYSYNNPINMEDSSGDMPKWAKHLLVGAAVVTTCAVASAVLPGVGGVIAGAALSGSLSGAGLGAATGAVIGGCSHFVTNGTDGLGKAIFEGACEGVAGGTFGGAVMGGGLAAVNIASGTTAIVGSAHGSPVHKLLSNVSAGNMASSGSYDTVYLNRGLKKAGLNLVNGSNLRPDVTGISKKVKSKVVEVVSAKQSVSSVVTKVEKMKTANKGIEGKTIKLLRNIVKFFTRK